MPSLNEIYSSLIENPDIQPPEGQDREAYVIDLAKQRLRQYKNNEKALSLGMQKTAIESLSDYVLTPLRKSMPTTAVGVFADFLQLAINFDDVMDENAMNSIIASGQPQIVNAVLSQYSKDDLQTKESRIKVLAEIRHLHYHRNAILKKDFEKRQRDWKRDFDAAKTKNDKIQEENKGKSDKDKKALIDVGPEPLKSPRKQLFIPSDKIAAQVDELVDEIGDNQLPKADRTRLERLIHEPDEEGKPKKVKHPSGKKFRDWGDEASWIKHIGYEQPPIAKPSQATEPQKDDEKGIAEKGWQILNSRIQDKLRYHFKDMYPSKDWDNFDINSPEHNDIMNDIVNDDRAAKDIKDILNETGRIDSKYVPEYDKFMTDGFGSKFFEVRSELYDGGRDEQDGVRTLIGEHFKDKKLTSASLTRMPTKALRDIFKEAGYDNAEKLHPAYMKHIVAQIFPSNITNPGQFELARDKQAEKVSSKWTADNLNQLYAPKALTFLRESFPEMTDDDLVKLAQTENAHDDSPNKGNIGGTNAKGRSVRLNLQTVRNTKFQNRHAESFGLDPVEEISTPSRKLSAVYDGINEDRVFSTRGGKENKFNWDGESRDSRDHFNTWRQNALDQFVADTGTFGISEQTQVLDDLFQRVSDDTGLPLSLVRIGSDENSDLNTMTAEMRQAIYNSMRSNIILHAERKGIPNREVAEGKEPDHTAKPLDVNPEDLAAHYTNGMNESLGYTDNIRETMKRIQARIDANDYPDTDQQGLGASRGADQAYLAKLRLREPRQEGIDMRQELREESGDYGYEFPAESEVRELQNARDVDAMMGAVKDQKRTPKKKDETPSAATTGDPNEIKDITPTGSAVDQLSDEAKKRQEEDQARKDKEDAAGNEEKSDGPAPIQWKEGDTYGTALPEQQFVRDTNGDLYVVRSKKGYMLELDGVNEEGNSRPSGNRTVNVDPSSAEYDKENEYFRHEINGQSTQYNLFRVNSGKEPLQINEEDMGKDEGGDPLPAISDEVQDYLKEAGKSAEEIKALFDTGELHDGDGNPIQLQTIKEQFPMKQPEGGEESTDSEEVDEEVVNESEASGMENIKNIITESDEVKDSVKEKVKEAKNIREINTAVSRENAPVNIEAIPSLPLTPSALTEAMRLGLFDLEGNPTPRGDHFLNMVGEAMPDIQEMMNTDDFKDAYKEKYTKTRFNPVRSLSKVAFNNIILGWNAIHDEDNQIAWNESAWDEETTQVTKMNGDPVDDDFYSKEFTFGDDAPHLKKAMWGDEEAEHNIFSRMIMSGIIAGRLGNAGQDEWDDLMKEGSLFKGRITQVNGDDVSGQDPINNDDLNTDEVKNEMEAMYEAMGGIQAGEEGENFIGDFGVIQDPQPEETDVDQVGANIQPTTGSGGGGSSQDKTATGSDDGEDDKEEKVTPPSDKGEQADMFEDQDLSDDNRKTPESKIELDMDSKLHRLISRADKDGLIDFMVEQEPYTYENKDDAINQLITMEEEDKATKILQGFHKTFDKDRKDREAAAEKDRVAREAAEEKDRAAAEKAQADEEAKAQAEADKKEADRIAEEDRLQEEATRKEQRVKMVQELKDAKNSDGSSVLPESAHRYLDSETDLSHDEIVALHRENVRDKAFTHDDPPPESEEPIDRERYYQELADYDGIDLEEAKKRYGEDGTYSDDDFKKKVNNMFNKPKAIPEDLDRDGMLDRIAELRGISKEEAERKYEHHDDKEIRQALHGQINQEASREAADKKTEEARIGKQNARDANASLKHRFKTPLEVKNEFDPDREGADEDGKMSTSEAADMFRSLLQHASQNHHHYDEAGIERLNELNHNLVRRLEESPEGLEELDKIHSEVQMATDLDIEYGSQEWYDHLDKTEADRAEKETREREQKEADEAEANRKFDDRETSLDRAFAHPHHKDHSNRLHSFDLEIEIGEDGKPTVTNAEHKGGIHHFEHSDGVVRENEHDAASHRGSGRSEHAPYDPDHTPEQAEIYQKIHAHRQRMDDLESPIRETDRRHSKEKADLQRKFDEASRTRATEHGRKRTRIQDTMHKKHAKITEAYDEEMATLSNDLDEVTLTIQDQMDTLREEKKAEYRELRSRHDRNASTSKERMDASESAINDQHGIHAKELEDLDAEHEQDRADFDAGTGRWDLDEMQRTNPEAAARYADPEQREAVKEEMYNKHASTRAELENTHADRIEGMEAFHAENISSHEETLAQHADEQEEFKRTSKEATEELQKNIVGAKKEIRDKMRDITSTYKEESDKISAKANEDYELHDNYVEGIEAEYQAEHDTNKESLASKHVAERAEAVGSAGSDMIEASRLDGMLREEYLNSAGDDEAARERLTRNLDNSDLGATETSYARHAEEESTRIQGEAQEAAQGMMDDDTPPPGSPSPTNPSLVYKPGPGKNWVTRDSYNAAVAKGLLARDNNSISFSNQGGNIIAHHGTDSWEVSEGVEGKGARTSQEAIGNAIHHGASQWTDEDGTSFADKTAALKEGESFEISHDHFNQHSPALVRGLKGQKPDGTTPTTSDTPTETGETPEEPKESSTSKFLGRMGTKVFSPVAQAIKQQTKTAKQNFANDLRENRWKQNNMFATGEGPSKRYQDGYTWYGKPKNIDPDKDHVGQASLGRELQRFNPFKGQKAKAEISTENQIENQSRAVQALQTHVQGQNSTLRQMGAQSSPTVKPTVGASTQTLKDHVQNKQSTGTTPPAPPA